MDTKPSTDTIGSAIEDYIFGNSLQPVFLCGDSIKVLKNLPSETIDCVMTSPPYWGQREYEGEGIGLEKKYTEYVTDLCNIIDEIKRVLKPTGSLWLNLGDTYHNKCLQGIPWRVVFELIDNRGWTLRNDIVWNKLKGGIDNSKDRLGNVHEFIFHLVKTRKYYYNSDAIRSKPLEAKVENGAVVSATGVTGVRYRRQIELSTSLTDHEKKNAFSALEGVLDDIKVGKLSDFRMVIRNQQRTTHSNSEKVSGRAKELRDKGFYFLKYNPKGAKPSDVWDIIPEDTQKRTGHYAAYPRDICRIPLKATCPKNGVVLDPFCGTGTTMQVAKEFGLKSIGIDLSPTYIEIAQKRTLES